MKSTEPVNQILRVDHLSVAAVNDGISTELVHDVSFSLGAGDIVSVVGESGSGKTTLASALARLLPPSFAVTGAVLYGGNDLLALPDPALRSILRSEIRYVFQEPGQALNPIARIGTQVRHVLGDAHPCERRYDDFCSMFGLPDTREFAGAYAHELSIGTLQRILLALALAPGPRVLIADEATSAIDSLLKHTIMDALRELCRTEGLSVLFITHDLALAKRYASRIAVMTHGRLTGGMD
jgi:ABC-type glutathione transport system ATPase component